MTGPKPSLARRLIGLGVTTALTATLLALSKGIPAPTKDAAPRRAAEPRRSALPEIVTYAVGYALALMLTVAAFALVYWRLTTPATALAIVFGLGLIQIVVHFRCFLHVTLHGPARDDLQLILFSTLIVLLMVGGTLVILFNLRMRMM